ncbi:hypothetical protein AB6802_05910 [Mesorhizobium sp. RCC_202]|uniref:hypothetical protein n=1 Tax=Mesorhizobium sp. RCC_202 TaxID=3239222 RepID=UPI003525344B
MQEELAECCARLGDIGHARDSARQALAVLEHDQVFVDSQPHRLARLRELAR